MDWIRIDSESGIEDLLRQSEENFVVLFKHSTRCSLSDMAENRLERSWNESEMKDVKCYFLDIIQHRDLSNLVVDHFGIDHESPQLLLIKDRACVYHTSHMDIRYDNLQAEIEELSASS